jgi:archaellum component FlaC
MNWQLIAQTANGGDFMISGNWLIAAAVAVLPILGGVWLKAKAAGKTEAESNNVTIKKPVPKVTVKEEPKYVTDEEMKEHLTRIERGFTEVKAMIENDRSTARTSIGNIHKRIDAMSESLVGKVAGVEAKIDAVAGNVELLLRAQINHTGGTRKA